MFKNLKEYCEGQYKKTVELDKKKQTCPKCGHETFCLYGENLTKGKCFHPECNLHLNLAVINFGIDYSTIIAERFFEHSKEKLFEKDSNNEFCRAYNYATKDRKIHDLILQRSDVGVIDINYDIDKSTEDLFRELKEKIQKETNEKELEKLNNSLALAMQTKEKIKQFIQKNWECLLFFYRNKNGLITRIKSRKPYIHVKSFQVCKIRDNDVGIFNNNLFFENESKTKIKNDKDLLVFEGEFDQLRFATWTFDNLCLIQSCALGGANGDINAALKLTNGNVCLIYDNDDAGISVLEKAQKIRRVYATTTPEPYKDIDEFINSFTDKKECYKTVLNLINNAKLYLRDFKGIKTQITAIMKFSGVHNLEKCQGITQIIIYELLQRGKFFKDNNFSYIFLDDNKRIIPIIGNNEELKLLLNRMGINAAKDYYNYVVNEIKTFAVDNGAKIEIHDFCYYYRKKNTLYIFNNDSIVYKITPNSIEEIENGDEGVMFNYKPDNESFKFVEIDNNINYFDKYVTNSMNVDTETTNLSAGEYKILLTIWFLSTFFESIMPSKVLLVAIGERGSRKTSTLRRLGIILFGSKYNVSRLPSKSEEFDTIITNSHLVILDNVDTGKPWLNDKLAMVATGQNIEKRILYTTNEMAKYPAKTYLAVTSRTPKFTRDDVADRLIGIYLTKVGDYIPENDVMVDVIENRNEIMSYIILKLQKVLQAFQTTKEHKYQTKFRIADFATFGLRIFDFLGKKEEFERVLDKVCTMQKEFAVEEDSLVYLLKIYAKNRLNPINAPVLNYIKCFWL